MRRCGNAKPEFSSAACTRSRDSRTAASPRPTIVKAGNPLRRSTSTVTRRDARPSIAKSGDASEHERHARRRRVTDQHANVTKHARSAHVFAQRRPATRSRDVPCAKLLQMRGVSSRATSSVATMSTDLRQQLGRLGEDLALEHLQRLGYRDARAQPPHALRRDRPHRVRRRDDRLRRGQGAPPRRERRVGARVRAATQAASGARHGRGVARREHRSPALGRPALRRRRRHRRQRRADSSAWTTSRRRSDAVQPPSRRRGADPARRPAVAGPRGRARTGRRGACPASARSRPLSRSSGVPGSSPHGMPGGVRNSDGTGPLGDALRYEGRVLADVLGDLGIDALLLLCRRHPPPASASPRCPPAHRPRPAHRSAGAFGLHWRLRLSLRLASGAPPRGASASAAAPPAPPPHRRLRLSRRLLRRLRLVRRLRLSRRSSGASAASPAPPRRGSSGASPVRGIRLSPASSGASPRPAAPPRSQVVRRLAPPSPLLHRSRRPALRVRDRGVVRLCDRGLLLLFRTWWVPPG